VFLAQEIDSSIIEKIKNKDDLPYTDDRGRTFGCGDALDCSGMEVIFYHFIIDKAAKN
jgi:hypothetical protein